MIKKVTTYVYDEDYDAPCPRNSFINTIFIAYAQYHENYTEITMNDGSKLFVKEELDDVFNWIKEDKQ